MDVNPRIEHKSIMAVLHLGAEYKDDVDSISVRLIENLFQIVSEN
jgi:hypothetical protein